MLALAVSVAGFGFAQTSVVPAIPPIQREFDASSALSAWLLSGYLIVAAATVPPFGKLADRHGRRLMMLVSLAIYFAGTVGAALAGSMTLLIVFRAVQGVGGAVFALGFSIAREQLPDDKVGPAIGALIGSFALGAAVGFGASGVIVEAIGWRPLFAFGAGAVVVAGVLVHRLVAPTAETAQGPIDAPGAVLLAAGLGALIFALTAAPLLGWASPLIIVGFALSPLLLAGWGLRERLAEEPLLDPDVLRNRTVALAYAGIALMGFVGFSVFLLIPVMVQVPGRLPTSVQAAAGFGPVAGPAVAGVFLLPAAVGNLLGGPPSGLAAARIGPERPFAAGLAAATAGAATLAIWHGTAALILVGALLVGIGFGIVMGSGATLITRAVRQEQTGVASAFVSVLLLTGGGIGSQTSSLLLDTERLARTPVPAPGAFTLAFWILTAIAAAATAAALRLAAGKG